MEESKEGGLVLSRVGDLPNLHAQGPREVHGEDVLADGGPATAQLLLEGRARAGRLGDVVTRGTSRPEGREAARRSGVAEQGARVKKGQGAVQLIAEESEESLEVLVSEARLATRLG